MRHPRQIIIAPILTEKTNILRSSNNCYTFKVSLNANKIEIRKAIEKIFNVGVVNVNTIRQNGKPKRMGKYQGRRADWKKAIVKLKSGDSLPDFEI